jgi:hypothetical protein
MEPLNDRELKELLDRWEAPGAPASLERRIFDETISHEKGRQRWYRWLLSGSIRVPVPVAAMLLVVLWLAWSLRAPVPRGSGAESARELTFSEFQPVKELKPRVVRSDYEGN